MAPPDFSRFRFKDGDPLFRSYPKKRQRYIRAPYAWSMKAVGTVGKVALEIRFQSDLQRHPKSFALKYRQLYALGLNRWSIRRALSTLERLGLIIVKRKGNALPIITILETAEE
jgi:hypothetical protein